MLETDSRRRLRVGLFTAALVILLGAIILMIGRKQGLFVRHFTYAAHFVHVGGLVPGAPVMLNGVVVGNVQEVRLSSDPALSEITIVFRVEARVAPLVRADSNVRIRTLGLLGDRYLEVSPGTPSKAALEEGAVVASTEPTDLTALLSQGGDAMANVQAISTSLRRILDRIERGEGTLGELTTKPESGRRAVAQLNSVLDDAGALLRGIREGKGALGRLVADPKLEAELVDNLAGLAKSGRRVTEVLARDLDRDDSVLAELLRDPEGRERVRHTLDQLNRAAEAAAAAGTELVRGKGTLGRLLSDETFAKEFLSDLGELTRSLRSVADKLDRADGTAGLLINDPTLWEDLEYVVRGTEKSRLVTWFVRNRRAAGERLAATPGPTPRPAAPAGKPNLGGPPR